MIQDHPVIQFIPENPWLQSVLSQIPALPDLLPVFYQGLVKGLSLGKDVDVLITSLPEADLIPLLPELGTSMMLVYCGEPSQFNSLSSDLAVRIDEYWFLPLTESSLTIAYQKLLKRLQEKWQAKLNSIFLNTVIDSMPDLVWFKDLRGSHLKVNEAFCKAVGKTKEQCRERGHYYIWDLKQEEYEKGEYVCLETEETVMKEKKTCLFDERVKSKSGMRQFKTYKSPLFDDKHELIGTVGVAHDVTDLQNMNVEIEIILRSLPFSVLVVDREGNVITVNPQFEQYFKKEKSEMIGMSYLVWKNNFFQGSKVIWDHNNVEVHSPNQIRHYTVHEEPIVDIFHDQVGYLCIWHDVTVEKSLRRQIVENANTDFLTKLYNRRYFYQFLAEQRKNQEVTLIYIDIDNFKQINDQVGHQVGDKVLVNTAQLIQANFPSALNTRLGGDEFLITIIGPVSVDTVVAQLTCLAQQLRSQLQEKLSLPEVTLSIGIATSQDEALPVDTLIQQADQALYQAKQEGKSKICFYQAR